jgi:hypothetical protein
MLGVPGEPAEASAGDGTTGAAIADYNGYTVTLSTTSDLTPYEVDPELAESMIHSCNANTGGGVVITPEMIEWTANQSSETVGREILVEFILPAGYDGSYQSLPDPTDFTLNAVGYVNEKYLVLTAYPKATNTSGTVKTETVTLTFGIQKTDGSDRSTFNKTLTLTQSA